MKAKHGERIVEFWKISHEQINDAWVNEAFRTTNIRWHKVNNDTLLVNAPWSVVPATIGDYLVLDEKQLKVVSNNDFHKDYKILN
ncbi:hypothetical protein ACUIJP_04845 [Leuconostoc pseudomesenteroides]|uniref:hypothetical protein n=1 Tax=Leuconostoc pseudomesenteroides TaxID=33968 RepID=UPI00403E2111